MHRYIKRTTIIVVAAITTIGFLNLSNSALAVVPGTNHRITLTHTGAQTTKGSGNPLISANGQVVVYRSKDTNILSSGGEGLFKHNLVTGLTERVNVSTAGVVSDEIDYTSPESISASGRYVLFRSAATNLIDGTTLPVTASNTQLYLRDTVASTTELISQVPGSGAGTISNGSIIIQGEGVSSDGRFVLFITNASNLHADATDGNPHVYMLDRVNGELSIIDRKTDGSVQDYIYSHNAMSAAMSCDGSLIVFQSRTNLIVGDSPGHSGVDIYLLDRRGDDSKLTNITRPANGPSYGPTISCNGDFIGFKTNANNLDSSVSITKTAYYTYPYILDRVNGTYHLASVTTSGTAPTGGICANGYDYDAQSVPCIWLSDTGVGVYWVNNSSLTGDSGRQVYLRNIYTNTTELVSKNSSGVASNTSYGFDLRSISADGSITTYRTDANNLISGDTNGREDIYTSLTGN